MATGSIFLPSNPFLEAGSDGTAKRVQRARRANLDVIADKNAAERDVVKALNNRLKTLQSSLKLRLLGDGVTDFRRFSLTSLLADVDRLVDDSTRAITNDTRSTYERMAELGEQAVDDPMKAAQLKITAGLPGLDATLVTAAFDNTVDLLTTPMKQFGTDVKVALRGVTLAGDQKFAAISKLRDKIGGAGFDSAQYKAERIIRTEVGRVFNEANYARMLSLAQEFPFLRKGWGAVGDSRTRIGHKDAGQKYGRGSGIPVSDKFAIQVYDERPGQAPKLIGTAYLRFPVDPQATPEGRIAAGATIMCRCHSFIDFDLADFAQFSAKQIQLALGGVLPPTVPPPAAAPAAAAPPPRTPRSARARVPKTSKAGVPVIPTAFQPGGTPVSAAIDLNPVGNKYLKKVPLGTAAANKVARALGIIDKVHGDGRLPKIPVYQTTARERKRAMAFYSRSARDEQPLAFGYGAKILKAHPNMGVFHETGHFLDHVGFDSDVRAFGSESDPVFEAWRQATKNSQSIQTLSKWRGEGNKLVEPGVNGVPMNVERRMVDYLLSTKEVWARSYAQWVATRSGDAAALRELANIQEASATATSGPIEPTRRYNYNTLGEKPVPGSWSYPWQWSDEDFKPIGEAIDKMMEVMGWRTKTAK